MNIQFFELEIELKKQIAVREVFIKRINNLSQKSIYRGIDLTKFYQNLLKEEEQILIPLLKELSIKKY